MMRISFFIFVLIHGLIHSSGFLKAFAFIDVKQISQNISRPVGMIWMLAGILLIVSAALYILKNSNWWRACFFGILLSQILIVSCWQDARFGTIINVVILLVIIIEYATVIYHSQYEYDVNSGLRQKVYFDNLALTDTDISFLPDPVKKYLRFAGSVGQPKVNNFKVEFKGKIRKDEQSDWMTFTSEQYNFLQTPTRLFFMKAVMKNLPVAGYHCFLNGHAYMDIRLLSLFKVQYQDGPEMDLSETVTFFNDMCCLAPATLIDRRIKWLEVDGNEVKASFTNNEITVSAWMYFNEEGALINFISQDRYSADAGKQLPWATPIRGYQQLDGYKLMQDAETIYSYPDRDLCYGTFNLVSVKYNCLSKQ
jgi:hypothetical protein